MTRAHDRAARLKPSRSLRSSLALLLLAPALVATAGEPQHSTPPAAPPSIGAACDGRSDAAPAFQAAYDALTASGGTILVPAGALCAIGGTGVEPRSNVALRCEKGSRLLALPGAQAMFRTTATLDDWSVAGCEFDLNGVAVTAWESSGGERGGTRWSFRDSYVHGMPAGDGPPISAVRLDCTLASGPCLVANNTIIGSGGSARRDTCLTVGAGGLIGVNTQVLGNYLQGCGGDCLAVLAPGGVTANDNVMTGCADNAVDNGSLNSVWTGNQLVTRGKDAGAVMSIHGTIGNQVIVGNQFAVNPRSSAPAVHAVASAKSRLAGLYIDSNYAAQGVWLDAKGRCEGGTCDGGACDGDGDCGGCAGKCTSYGIFDHDHVANLIVTGEIRIENATNLVVQGNVVIGTAGPGATAQILLTNPRADAPSGGIIVADNQLAKDVRARGRVTCIELDDVGGGGFSGVTITGNSCGEDPELDPAEMRSKPWSTGIRLTRPPRVWRSVLIADNNLGHTRDALIGFDTAAVRAGTTLSGNVGLDPADAQPVPASVRGAAVSTLLARARRDVARADTSAVAAEPALALRLEAGRSYAIDGHLRVRAADARSGLALGFAAPPAATLGIVLRADPGAGASVLLDGSDAPPAKLALAGGDNVVSVSGTVTTAASAGPLELRWAQGERGPAPLVLQSGSWLRAMELP